MNKNEFFRALHCNGIRLSLDGDENIKVQGARDMLAPELLEQIRSSKQTIVAWLKESLALVRPPIVSAPRETPCLPLSFAQRRLWFIDQLEQGSSQYNMSETMEVHGRFDTRRAENAFSQLIRRHESLRTVYVKDADGPKQVVREAFEFALEVVDATSTPEGQQQSLVESFVDRESSRVFDLSSDLMLRSLYIRLSETYGILLFGIHHIASDGWSMALLANEFVDLYSGRDLPPLRFQYVDYAHWQNSWLKGDILERQIRYWEESLSGLPRAHNLSTDYPRQARPEFKGQVHSFHTGPEIARAMEGIALQSGVTMFMVMHAAFAILLSRYSATSDIVIGTPVANRLFKEFESVVGFFVNTLVLRTDTSADMPFSEFLQEVRRVNVEAQAHQDVPFEHLVERLNPPRDSSHSPLFQIVMRVSQVAEQPEKVSDLNINPLITGTIAAKYDLDLNVVYSDQGIQFHLIFDRALFKPETIERLATSLLTLIKGISANPACPINSLPLMPAAEVERALALGLPQSGVPFDTNLCAHELFEVQVAAAPDRIAVSFGADRLTYAELNRRANRLAMHIRASGACPGEIVGLCLERSLDMLVGMLAIFKAGNVYLPLDLSHPSVRLEQILGDSGACYLLVHEASREKFAATSYILVSTDDPVLLSSHHGDDPGQCDNGPAVSDTAYVIYTSGSTGKPKGVLVTHANLSMLLQSTRHAFGITSRDSMAALASNTFDAALLECLMPLISGGEVVLVASEARTDVPALVNAISGCTMFQAVPTLMQEVAALTKTEQSLGRRCLPSLRMAFVGGEQVQPSLIRQMQSSFTDAVIVEYYGPTEATILSAYNVARRDDQLPSCSVLGRALPHATLYVLDRNLAPVPVGVPGELFIGGYGVAEGYLNRPELTAERFLCGDASGGRGKIYRSGDVVRWNSAGILEYLGRVDDQVKVNGHRIELGEIEFHINQVPGVQASVVSAAKGRSGLVKLAAHVKPDVEIAGQLSNEAFRERIQRALRDALPGYMCPVSFAIVDEWPRTPNGKIDRKALVERAAQMSDHAYLQPVTDTERTLVALYAELLLLECDALGAEADFFALGGHSLLMVRLAEGIKRHFQVEIPLRTLYNTATIREIGRWIDEALASARSAEPRDDEIEVEGWI